MGLPLAIKAHGEGNLAEAARQYERALDQNKVEPLLFQNYGALLRASGNEKKAEIIYKKGLSLYPNHSDILPNYANLLKAVGRSSEALQCYLTHLRFCRVSDHQKLKIAYAHCIDLLLSQNRVQWALQIIHYAIDELGLSFELLWSLFRICNHEGGRSFTDEQQQLVLNTIEVRLDTCTALEKAEFIFARSFFELNREDLHAALKSIDLASQVLNTSSLVTPEDQKKAQKLYDRSNWNSSCILLKHQLFKKGWSLYEYGLRTPAPGKQKWQRALKKPFSFRELPLWRGSDLTDQRILLLEEQAVGDTMMFASLLPALIHEAAHLGLLLSDRLLPIYRRSLLSEIKQGVVSIWSQHDVADGKLQAGLFDVQCPLGSICQHRFTAVDAYSPRVPFLVADGASSQQFRSLYSAGGAEKIIGISWRGGAQADRMKKKSIDVDLMAELMKQFPHYRFISLQYGDAKPVISNWQKQGIPVIHDEKVNPLKNMELWLNQVAACDAVISVANTTIHGAGGLNIPTQCLLSLHSDWRWLSDSAVMRSYWYPSVGIARETKQQGWQPALLQVSNWLQAGCPMPDGPVHTESDPASGSHAFVEGDQIQE